MSLNQWRRPHRFYCCLLRVTMLFSMNRQLAACLGVMICTFVVGCGHSSPINVPVIDIHTHAFNARDLPLKGIFCAKGVPDDVAGSLAKVINFWTPEDHQ